MVRPRLMAKRRAFNTFLDEDQYRWLGREAAKRGLQPSVYLRMLIDDARAVQTQPEEKNFHDGSLQRG